MPLDVGFPAYDTMIVGLKGEIVDDELWFSLNFGSFPTSFRGARLKK